MSKAGPKAHTCHVPGCSVPISRTRLMCLRHWRMVPPELQQGIWATYSPGQELHPIGEEQGPSEAYLLAAQAAIVAVSAKEAAGVQSAPPPEEHDHEHR